MPYLSHAISEPPPAHTSSKGQGPKYECWLQDTGSFHFCLDKGAVLHDFPCSSFILDITASIWQNEAQLQSFWWKDRCNTCKKKTNGQSFLSTPFSLTIPQSLSLTLSKVSVFSSTAHCPWITYQSNLQILLWRTSSVKPPNPTTTSSVESMLSRSIFARGYSETGHLTHSVTPKLLQFSPFWSACFLYP